MSGTFESRISNSEYKNWLKAGLALVCLKDGLFDFVTSVSKTLHSDIVSNVTIPNVGGVHAPCTSCTAKNITQDIRKQWSIKCPNHVCDQFLREILLNHWQPKYNAIPWSNSDPTKWPSNHWEVTKIYMSQGQTRCGGANDFDCASVLNFILNCKKFGGPNPIVDNGFAEKVRGDRNTIMHSGLLALSTQKLHDSTSNMVKVLKSMQDYNKSATAQSAVTKIESIRDTNIEIKTSDEVRCIHDAQKALGENVECLQKSQAQTADDIKKAESRLEDLHLEVQAEQQSLRTEYNDIHYAVGGMRNSIKDHMETITKLQIACKCLEDFISKNTDLQAEISTELKGTRALLCQVLETQELNLKQADAHKAHLENVDDMLAALDNRTSKSEQDITSISSRIRALEQNESTVRGSDPRFVKLIEETMMFVESRDMDGHIQTSMVKTAKKRLKDHSCVVVSGNPGEGKTSVGVALMREFGAHNRRVMLSNARDWDCVHVLEVDVVFIDDIFGVHQLDSARLNEWMAVLDRIQACVSQSKMKLVIATRTHILNECISKLKRYPIFEHVIIFSSEKLTAQEKTQIFQYWLHKSGRHCDEISTQNASVFDPDEWSIGFPFCCFLVVSDDSLFKNRYTYFSQPLSYIRKNLEILEDKKLLALACLFCMGSKIHTATFILKEDKERTILLLSDLADTFGVEICPKLGTIRNCLDTMSGVYVEKYRENYRFIHTVISDSVGLVIGRKDPQKIIELGSIDILCACTCLERHTDDNLVYIPEIFYQSLIHRLLYELFNNFESYRVVNHPAFLNKTFVKALFHDLEATGTVEKFLKCETLAYTYGTRLLPRIFSCLMKKSVPINVVEVFMNYLKCDHSQQEGLNSLYCWKCHEKQSAFENSIFSCDICVPCYFLDRDVMPTYEAISSMLYNNKKQVLNHALPVLTNTQSTNESAQTILNRALCDAYRNNTDSLENIEILLRYGAVVCPVCVTSAKTETLVKHALEHLLKIEGYNNDNFMHSVLHLTYERNYGIIEDIFMSCEHPSCCCIKHVIRSGNSKKVRCVLENLQKRLHDSEHHIFSGQLNSGLREAYLMETVDMINVLKDFGAEESVECFAETVACNNTKLVQDMLKNLSNIKERFGLDDPILQNTLLCRNWDVLAALLDAGVRPTMYCFVNACTGMLDPPGKQKPPLMLVKQILRTLEQTNCWDPDHSEVDFILRQAYVHGNSEIQKMLSNAGVKPTVLCLTDAIFSCSIVQIEDLINQLKGVKNWHTSSEFMTTALVKSYLCSRTDILKLLKDNGVLLNCSVLTQVVLYGHLGQVKIVVTELKDANLWDPEDPMIVNAYNHAILLPESTIYSYLESEGVNADMSTILHCLETLSKVRGHPTVNNIKDVIRKLQASGQWNAEDQRIKSMLEETFNSISDHKELLYLDAFCKAGVKLSTGSMIRKATRNGSVQVIEQLIQMLSDSRKVLSDSSFAQSLLIQSMKKDNMDMVQFLTSEEYAHMTEELLEGFTANEIEHSRYNWTLFIIKNLQKIGTWNPAKDVVIQLFNRTFSFYNKEKGASLRQELMQKGVQPTLSSLTTAIKHQAYCFVPGLIKHLKDIAVWNAASVEVAASLEDLLNDYRHGFYICSSSVIDLAELLLEEGAIPTARAFFYMLDMNCPYTANKERISLLRNMIRSLKRYGQKDSNEKLFQNAFERRWFCRPSIAHFVLIEEEVIKTGPCLQFAVETRDKNLLEQTIRRSKSANEWSNCSETAVKVLESTMLHSENRINFLWLAVGDDTDFVLAKILMREGVVPTTTFLHNVLQRYMYSKLMENNILHRDKEFKENSLQFLRSVITKIKEESKWEPNSYLLQSDFSDLLHHQLQQRHIQLFDGETIRWTFIPAFVSGINEIVDNVVGLNSEQYDFRSIFGSAIGQRQYPVTFDIAWILLKEGVFPYELCLLVALRNLNLNLFRKVIDKINLVSKPTFFESKMDVTVQNSVYTWLCSRYNWYSERRQIPEEIFNVVMRNCETIARELNVRPSFLQIFESSWDSATVGSPSVSDLEDVSLQLVSDMPFSSQYWTIRSSKRTAFQLCQLKINPYENQYFENSRTSKIKTLFVEEGTPFYYLQSDKYLVRKIVYSLVSTNSIFTKSETIDLVADTGQDSVQNVMWNRLETHSMIIQDLNTNNLLSPSLCLFASVASENIDLVEQLIKSISKGEDWYLSDLYNSFAMETAFCGPLGSFRSPAMKAIREIFLKKGISVFFDCSKDVELVSPLPSNHYLLLKKDASQPVVKEILHPVNITRFRVVFITPEDS